MNDCLKIGCRLLMDSPLKRIRHKHEWSNLLRNLAMRFVEVKNDFSRYTSTFRHHL